jgi:hypothetical protein
MCPELHNLLDMGLREVFKEWKRTGVWAPAHLLSLVLGQYLIVPKQNNNNKILLVPLDSERIFQKCKTKGL